MERDTITIDRELFDDLTECAIDCEANRRWRRKDSHECKEWDKKIPHVMAKAVAIRDAPPQGMTDSDREAWIEASKYEVQLQAAAQRLQAAMGKTEAVDAMGVVAALDELIAKHAVAIEQISEAQRKIIDWLTRKPVLRNVQLFAERDNAPTVGIGAFADIFDECRESTALDPSRCLLTQIAGAIEAWKRIHLRSSDASE